jgi:hypothetical protein
VCLKRAANVVSSPFTPGEAPETIKRREIMYLEEIHLFSDKMHETPKIHWDEDDKYAIIGFLLMSIDKKADEEGKARLDDLFGLNETAPKPEGGESGESNEEKKKARDMVVRECEKFLAGLDDGDRYDCIMDAIDKFIEGEDGRNLQCVIGDSYGTLGAAGRNKLEGAVYRLWDLTKLVVFDADYLGNKKRLLKHLARKWDIESSVLPVLENAAKTLAAIKQERQELVESDKPYRGVTAALAGLEAREKETWRQLEKLGVYEDDAENGGYNQFDEEDIAEDDENEYDGYSRFDEIVARISDGASSFLNQIADGLENFAGTWEDLPWQKKS